MEGSVSLDVLSSHPAAARREVAASRSALRWSGWTLGLCAIVFAGPLSQASGRGDDRRALLERIGDSELTAVTFVDAERGWAVGDRGAIWRTSDAGRTWRPQLAPIDAHWKDVTFVDGRHGWIVGGRVEPGTRKTTGAVLRTRDGGETWTPLATPTLPELRRVIFDDEKRGWAIGFASAMYPAGVFTTDDGGRSWSPVPGRTGQAWLTGDVRRGGPAMDAARGDRGASLRRLGVVAGADGKLAVIQPQDLLETQLVATPRRAVRDVRLTGPDGGWLVGDGGLVLETRDGGLQWHPPQGTLPESQGHFDWQAVAARGERIWVAGSPGSAVMSSRDGGATWQLHPTGQTATLKSLVFVDDDHGWAVGSLGVILATRDGGRTWKRQQGATRLALLVISSQGRGVPFELLTQACENDGYRGGAIALFRRDLEVGETAEAPSEERFHEAVVVAGGAVAQHAWNFPTRQRGLPWSAERHQEGWRGANSAEPHEALEIYLAERIRQWRPDVIVTDEPDQADDVPLAQLTQLAVLAAVERAAGNRGSSDETPPGLTPWQVKKVFGVTLNSERGSIRLATSQLAPRIGRSLADYALWSRELMDVRAVPEQYGFRPLASHLAQDSGRRDLFGGLTIPPGSESRRATIGMGQGEASSLQRTAQLQRNVQQLMLRAGDPVRGAAWLAQYDDLTRGFAPDVAGELAWQLARRYDEAGQYELAEATWRLILQRYPQQPWANGALVELAKRQSSAEWAHWRRSAGTDAAVTPLAATSDASRLPFVRGQSPTPVAPSALVELPVAPAIRRPGRIAPAAATEAVAPITAPTPLTTAASPIRSANANSPADAAPTTLFAPPPLARFAQWIERNRPWLYAEPSVQAMLAIPAAQDEREKEIIQAWRLLARSARTDGWPQVARQELELIDAREARKGDRAGASDRVLVAAATESPPHLDGQLDEEFWRSAAPAALRSDLSDDADWPAEIRVAYDDEHLYLAVRAAKHSACDYRAPAGKRSRDPDLRQRDRVEFYFDTNRDYATAFRLTVDAHGWAADDCAGDARWNPQWFVAAASDDATWTIEAAIPWTELTSQPPRAGDAWALGAQRVAPFAGFQAWTRPAAVEVRSDGWGLLKFQ